MTMVRMPGTMVLSRIYSSELADRTSAGFKEVERAVCDEVKINLKIKIMCFVYFQGGAAWQTACNLMNLIKVYSSSKKQILCFFSFSSFTNDFKICLYRLGTLN